VISRRADGRATIRAIRLDVPLVVDGRLDDSVYHRELPFGGLIQVAPDYGEPQTERRDVWVTYDGSSRLPDVPLLGFRAAGSVGRE
jgi:hypothetical protein